MKLGDVPVWVWVAGAAAVVFGGVMAGSKKARDAVVDLSGYLISSTAQAKGYSNAPDSETDLANLTNVIAANEPRITALLREYNPQAHFTSVYRSDVVNDAVGGSESSRHRLGLAIDYNVGGDVVAAARWLRTHAARLPLTPRTVIAETTPIHLHLDFFSPSEAVQATKWRMESGGANNFVPLT
jgi:hypothetical protein